MTGAVHDRHDTFVSVCFQNEIAADDDGMAQRDSATRATAADNPTSPAVSVTAAELQQLQRRLLSRDASAKKYKDAVKALKAQLDSANEVSVVVSDHYSRLMSMSKYGQVCWPTASDTPSPDMYSRILPSSLLGCSES